MRLTIALSLARTFSRGVQSMVTSRRPGIDELVGALRLVAQYLHCAVLGLQGIVEGDLVLLR